MNRNEQLSNLIQESKMRVSNWKSALQLGLMKNMDYQERLEPIVEKDIKTINNIFNRPH